jgi:hypothetical protein
MKNSGENLFMFRTNILYYTKFFWIKELYTRCVKVHPLYPAKCELSVKALIEAAVYYYVNRVIFFFGRIKLIADGSSLG